MRKAISSLVASAILVSTFSAFSASASSAAKKRNLAYQQKLFPKQ